jgi:hypothetical protein
MSGFQQPAGETLTAARQDRRTKRFSATRWQNFECRKAGPADRSGFQQPADKTLDTRGQVQLVRVVLQHNATLVKLTGRVTTYSSLDARECQIILNKRQ